MIEFPHGGGGESKGLEMGKEIKEGKKRTRPDTRQSSRGRLGRSGNSKTDRKFRNICDGRTDGRTDRHGKV